jgi:hypothetical protein
MANFLDALWMLLMVLTGGDGAVKWMEPDRTVTAPCSTVAECQEVSKAHESTHAETEPVE